VLAWLVLLALPGLAVERVQLHATAEAGFGRLVLQFPDRFDLPAYKVGFDNNVLSVTFSEPVSLPLPDVGAIVGDYLTIGRVDPDGRGVRFGLRAAVNIHSMEAGEKLFIDMMPPGWQGLPPALPPEVVAELTERAKANAVLAEQTRKAEEARTLNPQARLHIGRAPTFFRIEFEWSADTQATFQQDGAAARLVFDWPVPVDLYALKADMPAEILGAANDVSATGSAVNLSLLEGVTPRFYVVDKRHFTLDIDLTAAEAEKLRSTAEAAARAAEAEAAAARAQTARQESGAADAAAVANAAPEPDDVPGMTITPVVEETGGTVRVAFPFERDIASAVFRRGNTLWMLFDTPVGIAPPARSDALDAIASGFSVIPAGETQIVRVDLSTQRLATLASEGRAWVLSVGDVLLNATEPLGLRRNRDRDGHFEMLAELGRPYKVHSFRDPVVGDVLDVVTAFAPARGAVRDLDYVDFDALRSMHGLVVRADNPALKVELTADAARLTTPEGLTLSDQEAPRQLDAGNAAEFRDSFVDFAVLRASDPGAFAARREELSVAASSKEGRAREVARLGLAQFYVGNQFAQEALGVLGVLDSELKSEDLRKKVRLTTAIADVLAGRPLDALAILTAGGFAEEVDAVMWRTMARADSQDFVGARKDALVAEAVIEGYPVWVQQKFLFDAARAALETSDVGLAQHSLERLAFAQLDPEQVTLYQLLQGRIAEAAGRFPEALESYGQVIAADIRPTRAEAVYRTLLVLRATGQIDLAKATETLSAEAMLWRGNALEVDMEKLLAELYFDHKDFRLGFEIVREAAAHNAESKPIEALMQEAQEQFAELFLNGAADQLADLDALSLYYDFRELTPPGPKGDEMIRNLAQRLVKVDLLAQAADLLEYQIDSRLEGVAKAQVAADLALIRIAERNPEGALRALNRTRVANLAPSLERRRRILEARALIDADREDLAIDLLGRVEGRDADLLRVDGYWKARNYLAASNLIETVYAGENGAGLTQAARLDIIKAAVGLVLADDTLGLSRLRSKFAERMAQTAEWGLFDYITQPDANPVGQTFKTAAKMVANIDSITAFLDAYRDLYPAEGAMTPREAARKTAV
jgi:hypothetical protein